MGQAIGGLFGIEKPKPQPVMPASPPPPMIDAAQERQTATDRLRFRRGAASTRLTSAAPGGGGRTAVYRALGGSS